MADLNPYESPAQESVAEPPPELRRKLRGRRAMQLELISLGGFVFAVVAGPLLAHWLVSPPRGSDQPSRPDVVAVAFAVGSLLLGAGLLAVSHHLVSLLRRRWLRMAELELPARTHHGTQSV